jgi:curved DNA-binding protein CbpA
MTVAGRRPFHQTSHHLERTLPNHYETLSVPTNASPTDIKKQFYKLSKSNHPDLHPNDPGAAQRFVRISEAYATLSSPAKRSLYDRDFLQSTSSSPSSSSSPHPNFRGSYSSASASSSGPGGRPASGLSRRRTQFRGPPPSFYRNGGWGEHGDKRGAYASQASHTHEAQGRSASGADGPSAHQATSSEPGIGPGGFTAGFDNDVPHFDHVAHAQTHEEIDRMRRRAREQAAREEDIAMGRGNSGPMNFFVMMGVLGVVVSASGLFAAGPVVPTTAVVVGGKERKGKTRRDEISEG